MEENPTQTQNSIFALANEGEPKQTVVETSTQPVEKMSRFNDLVGEDGKFVDRWTEKLSDGYREHSTSLSKFKDPLAMLASYVSLEKEYGRMKSTKVKLPGDEATDEDWSAYREAVGAPKDVKDYGLSRPEEIPEENWNSTLADSASNIALKYGIPKKALHELVGVYNNSMKNIHETAEQAMNRQIEEGFKSLKTEWGAESKSNFQKAERAALALGLDVTDPSLGSNTAFIKALVKMDSLLGEDKGLIGGHRETYQEQYDRLLKEMNNTKVQSEQLEILQKMKAVQRAMQS